MTDREEMSSENPDWGSGPFISGEAQRLSFGHIHESCRSRSRGRAAPGPGDHKQSQAEDHGKLHPYKDENVRMAPERWYARKCTA